jgi:hypothetical protein
MKSSLFCDIIPCSLLKVNWCFRETYHLNHQGQKSGPCCLLHADFLFGSFFDSEDGGDIFLQNISWLSVDSKTLVDFQWTTLSYISDDSSLQRHQCEKLRFSLFLHNGNKQNLNCATVRTMAEVKWRIFRDFCSKWYQNVGSLSCNIKACIMQE